MIKAIHAILVLALACLFTVSAALPSVIVLNRSVSAARKTPNEHAPCTLLGKPYRSPWDGQRQGQSCSPSSSPSRWTRALDVATTVTDRRHDPGIEANHEPPHQAQAQARMGSEDIDNIETALNAKEHAKRPLPLVLNKSPESGSARSRLLRLKRLVRFNQTDQEYGEEHHVQSSVAPTPGHERGAVSGSREVSTGTRGLTRLYARGEWKSRLSGDGQ